MRESRVVTMVIRQALDWLGLKPYAKRLFIRVLDDERQLSIGGTEVTFAQLDFGDYIELNQVAAERQIIRRLRQETAADDVFLDIGSNIGVYAVSIGRQLADGTTIAVEAVPSTADKLVKNLERNSVDGSVENVAFTDEPGQVTVAVPEAHGSSSLTSGGEEARTVRVNGVCGDSYLDRKGYPTPNILKIDVEGHERAVLRGLETTLSKQACRLVYCEVHHDHGSTLDEGADSVHSILRGAGFTLARDSELPGERHIVRASKE